MKKFLVLSKTMSLSLAALLLTVSAGISAQENKKPEIVIRDGQYVRMEPKISVGNKEFQEKSTIVRDAYRKKEIKRQKDEQALPAPQGVRENPNGDA